MLSRASADSSWPVRALWIWKHSDALSWWKQGNPLFEGKQRDNLLDEILDREWAHRAWTFQELVLARYPVIMCGAEKIAWEDLVNAIYVMSRPRTYPIQYPVSSQVLEHWRSMIDLWFWLPRRWPREEQAGRAEIRPDVEAETVPESSMASFREWERTTKLPGHIPFTAVPGLLSFGSWPMLLCAVGIFSILVMGISRRIEDENPPEKPHKMLVLTKVMGWVLCAMVAFIWLAYAVEWWDIVVFGERHWQAWLQDDYYEDLDSRTLPVDAIRAALRERRAREPSDMAFSLSGILKACGANPSKPDYKRSVAKTYEMHFQDLLQWRPEALSMVMDAGGVPTPDHHVSWVPDWAKQGPSVWLTSGCRLSYGTSAVPSLWRTERLEVAVLPLQRPGPTLKVRGRKIGTVAVLTLSSWFLSTESLTGPDLENALATNTRIFSVWCRYVQSRVRAQIDGDTIEGYQFAVLEGVVRTRQPLIQSRRDYRGEIADVWVPNYEAPLDFSDRVGDFLAFCELWELICLHRDRSDNGIKVLMEQLKRRRNKNIWNYMLKAITRLVQDKRNLFIMSGPNYTHINSDWLGSGPPDIKIDDEIWIIHGIPTPMALRHAIGNSLEEKTYKVVGAVLVHGFMDGMKNDGPAWEAPENVFLV